MDYKNCRIYNKNGVQIGYVENGEIYKGNSDISIFVERIGTIAYDNQLCDRDGKHFGSIDSYGNIVEGSGLFCTYLGSVGSDGAIFKNNDSSIFNDRVGSIKSDSTVNRSYSASPEVTDAGVFLWTLVGFAMMFGIYLLVKLIKGVGAVLGGFIILLSDLFQGGALWLDGILDLAYHLFEPTHPASVVTYSVVVASMVMIIMAFNDSNLKENYWRLITWFTGVGALIWLVWSIYYGYIEVYWVLYSFPLYLILMLPACVFTHIVANMKGL